MDAPRLAESPAALWERIVDLCNQGVHEPYRGIVRPVVRFKTYTFYLRGRRLFLQHWQLLSEFPATEQLAERFHDFLSRDLVTVLTQTAPGYPSEYREPRTLRLLHQPAGQWPQP